MQGYQHIITITIIIIIIIIIIAVTIIIITTTSSISIATGIVITALSHYIRVSKKRTSQQVLKLRRKISDTSRRAASTAPTATMSTRSIAVSAQAALTTATIPSTRRSPDDDNLQALLRSFRLEDQKPHLDDTFGVAYSSCERTLGQFSCHHVTAALVWPSYIALPREVTDGDRKFMHDELDKLGRFTALRWILSLEPPVEEPIITFVEYAVLSQAYMEEPCKQSWLSRALLLSPSRIADIAKRTAGQRTNPLWCIVRKHRITASNFGAVLRSIGRNRYPTSLMKRLLSAFNLEAVKSVAWEINHESVALRAYEPGDGFIENTGI
ncbi:uncharacterized protein [Haliotis cracherodii]|uniref:uncharacterized protein n=1 Tax=Haliotis cracherodii TaxID=6455 RepID=UPI0039ED7690